MERSGESVGAAIPKLLAEYGVDTIFGIPGVHNVELYRGLPETPIRHVLPRHEQGAGFMADGYARSSGRPGVCFVISGPGVTNISTPVGQAYSDSQPLLVIASGLDVADLGRGRGRLHEVTDQISTIAPLCGFATRALAPDAVPEALARAFAGFAAERPRPAYVEIPIDVLAAPARGDWQAVRLPKAPPPHAGAISQAARLLRQAKKPLIIAGGGSVGCGKTLGDIAQALGAPVMTTVAGKGVIAADHPLCLGACLPHDAAKAAVAASDCLLVLGSELSETDLWEGALEIAGDVIRVDLDPDLLVRPYPARLPILADAALAARDLAAELSGGYAPRLAAGWQNAGGLPPLRAALVADEPEARKGQRRILDLLRQVLPEDLPIASDMTQIAYSANEIFPVSKARRWLHPVGYGTLGYALPAAIGASLAEGNRPAAALIGDYGLQFTLPEMAVARELDLPLIVFLWNNSALGEIRDDMKRKQIPIQAVEQTNPDFQLLARAYGYDAAQPANLDELASSAKAALTRSGPSLIEITPAIL
jgi:5-guanidino-2-oxopentanoate decarboxylase